ncbi:MAG: hypothetical protein HKN91_08430 [Acidimicrobiia bacterium]|nr:hypothetical protein [Acidimicrobiia bacterium]
MKRFLITSGLAVALLATQLGSATADELTGLIEAAAEADYSGRQIVVTFLDGETTLEIVDVEHAGSLTMVGNSGGQALLGDGKLSGADGGLAVSEWNAAQMSDKYTVGAPSGIRRLNRQATAIDVFEDGQLRMRRVFDDATGTPLVTEVYGGDGKMFRLTSMLEVNSLPAQLYAGSNHDAGEYEMLLPTANHDLPGQAADYFLADAYAGVDDSLQGFYSDGLFSFSLFQIEGRGDSGRFSGATTLEIDNRQYQRLVNPGEMWVTWRSGANTYVLVGDLPPDHLEQVLDGLPKPGSRNLFSRLWNGLFG